MILGFLLSIFGLFALLGGMIGFFLLPIVPKVLGRFKGLARVYLWFMAQSLTRGAFVVSEQGDLLLKRMQPTDQGTEEMGFGDVDKQFEDPDNARHYWHGIPFALADEVHGILFDPRHAAIGTRVGEYMERDQLFYPATEGERDTFSVSGWVRGVFELPTDRHELVDLNGMRHLITGLERAEHPAAVEAFRKYAEEAYQDTTSTLKILALLAAILGPFLALFGIAKYFGAPSGTIGFAGLLFAAGVLPDWDIELWDVLAAVAVVALVLLPFGVIAWVAGLQTALVAALTVTIGWVLMGALLLGLGRVVGGIPRLFLKLGMMGYDKPVFVWTPKKYVLKEARHIDHDDGEWYGVGGAVMGVSYEPGEQSFDGATANTAELQALADSTTERHTNLPVGTVPRPDQRRAEYLAGFIPVDISAEKLYVDSDILLSAFTHAAVGLKSHRSLMQAKRKYGGDAGLQDTTFMYVLAGLASVSFLAGVGVFFL